MDLINERLANLLVSYSLVFDLVFCSLGFDRFLLHLYPLCERVLIYAKTTRVAGTRLVDFMGCVDGLMDQRAIGHQVMFRFLDLVNNKEGGSG